MRTVYLDHLKRPVTLDRLLAGGREGEVWLTSAPGVVVKVFKKTPPRERVDKLEQMRLARVPAGQYAWPLGLARDGAGGAAVGFAMDLVSGIALADLWPPTGDGRTRGLDFLARLELAADLSALFESSHAAGLVHGDVSARQFLAATDAAGQLVRPARVVALDCDDMQFHGRDPATGMPRYYPSGHVTPGFIPPELLQIKTLEGLVRTPAHDRFGLATLNFMIVKGDLAFAAKDPTGQWLPDQDRLVREGRFPYAPVNPLPPGVVPRDEGLPWARIPAAVRGLFVRCFRDGDADPDARPTPGQWRAALERWLAAERAKLPGAGAALWQYLRGRLSRQRLLRAVDLSAGRRGLAACWKWLLTGDRARNLGTGLGLAALVGFGLAWNPQYEPDQPPAPTAAHAGTDGASRPGNEPAGPAPVDPARAARREAERREAEARWRGAPSIFREALDQTLEDRP